MARFSEKVTQVVMTEASLRGLGSGGGTSHVDLFQRWKDTDIPQEVSWVQVRLQWKAAAAVDGKKGSNHPSFCD